MSLKTYYSSLVILALVSHVFAAPSPGGILGGSSQCDPGKSYCCDSLESSDSEPDLLNGLLGLGLGDVPVQLGLGCTPINVIGVLTGPKCTAQPACCQSVQSNGVANLACTPLSL